MNPPRQQNKSEGLVDLSNLNGIAAAIRRGELVDVGQGLQKQVVGGKILLSAKNPPPEFLAGFVAARKSPTTVTVRSGYTCDRIAGATLYDDLVMTIEAEAYLFAKYIHATGWEVVSSHVVQQAAALPAADAAYVIYPIAKIEWRDPPGQIGKITQYDVGNLVGAEKPAYRAFFAKITGRSSGNYAFAEQAHDGAGVFSDRAGGYSGTTSVGPAREASGLAVDLAEDIIVPMVRVPSAAGADTFVFTLAHWLADTTTSLSTSDGFDANETAYVLPRTANLEIPVFSRVERDGSKLAVFARNLKLDANGNPVALAAEVRVIDCHVVSEGTAQWDVLTWDAVSSRWIPDVVRGHG